jgi:glutathione S-transferase
MITLYQFPISHYCEKIRWALDYKNISYKIKNLLPGLHLSKARKLAPDTSVPILVDDNRVIQGSDSIITYLDETYAGQSLTPATGQLKKEALEWEQYVDREVGIHVRRCCYHILLEHPDIMTPFFTHQGPWYGKIYIHYAYPRLIKTMRKFMNINEESEQRSRETLGTAIDRLHNHLQENNFLVGDQFSRADLSAASLLAPLCMPEKYGLNWPDQLPPEFEMLVNGFQSKINWVNEIYDKYR